MKYSLGGSALAALIILFGFTSCGPTAVDSYPSLVNQGVLSLSTTNPYLGSNLFLARELERSTFLFNFFKTRGAPVAVEIIEPKLNVPRLLLYYPIEREVYAADSQPYRQRDGRVRNEWIIRGPFEMERKDYRNLVRMQTAMTGEPVFMLYGKTFRFRFHRDRSDLVRQVIPEVPPTPTPKPKPRTQKSETIVAKGNATPTPTEGPFRPLTSDQQALQMARGFARRADNGDVIHQTRGKETLEEIVRWYTKSGAALETVLKANNLPSGTDPLPAGESVQIPMHLVKEFKAMP